MIRATLEGNRRIIRLPIDRDISNSFDIDTDGTAFAYIDQETGDSYKPTDICKYKSGNILWVREAWADVNTEDGPAFTYRADNGLKLCSDDAWPVEYERYPNCDFTMWCGDLWRGESGHSWRRNIHMPRFAARIFLKVTNVRIEQLQNVTEEETEWDGLQNYYDENSPYMLNVIRFKNFWNNTYTKRNQSYEENPWIWTVEFERIYQTGILRRMELKSCL